MRMVLTPLFLMTILCGNMTLCEEEAPQVSHMSIADIDARMKAIKEDIQVYQNRAFYADKEAQQLTTHDFFGYRQALNERDQNQQIVIALKKELANLEQQRGTMVENEKAQRG